jgi:ABC-2 type transport system permease protein
MSYVPTIVRAELKRRKMYMFWWGLGVTVLCAFTVLAYGSIKSQADELNTAFADLSNSAGSFFGTSDMFSPNGYLNSQLFYITLPILFIILGVTLSSSLTYKEERSRTLELLLARPISRSNLLIGKMLSACVVVAILTVITAVSIVICSVIVGLDVSIFHIVLATIIMSLFAGAFGAVAFMLYTASTMTQRMAAAVAILLSLGGYIITSVGGIVSSLSWLTKVFPYHYYNPGDILNGQVSIGLFLYIIILYLIAVIVSLIGFRRRDIE